MRGCAQAGVDALYQHGRNLVGDRTAKSRLKIVRVNESHDHFADDVALYTKFRGRLNSATNKFVEGAGEWGLTMSIEHTKAMAVGERLDEDDTAHCKWMVER